MNPVSQELGPCPCGTGWDEEGNIIDSCLLVGTKLTKYGHLVGCLCRSCIGRRNKRKGQHGQAKGHKALGGVGFTPSNEESHGGYDVRVQVEHKSGDQVPMAFRRFIATDWFGRALSQAERAVRVGDGAMPSVMIDGRWLVVDCKSVGPSPLLHERNE